MTSKRSFINIMKEDVKRRIWPIALSVIGFFFALPVLALIKVEDHLESLREGWDTLYSLQVSYARYTLGPENGFAITGLIIMAALNAIHGMKYLHSRQEADFYGSIPMLRTEKFAAAYINGIIIAIIPYWINQIIAAIIGSANGLITPAGFMFGIQTMLLETAGFLLIYSFIIIAAVLTGHTAVTVAGAVVLLFAPLAYIALIDGYSQTFFITRYQSLFYLNYYWFSPVTLVFEMLTTYTNDLNNGGAFSTYSYQIFSLIAAVICVALSVILYFLTRWLIMRRPAEAAGRAMAFDKTKPVIKVIIMIPVTLALGLFFPSLSSANGSRTYAWLVFGLIMGILLSHSVIEIIYEFDFKACAKHIPSGIVAAVITALTVSFFVFDFTGFDTKLPDKGKIETAAVYLPGIDNGDYYAHYDYMFYNGQRYSPNESDVKLDGMNLTDIDDVYTLAEAGCDYARKFRWRGSSPKKETAYEDTPSYIEVSVALKKHSGKEYRRSYYIDKNDAANYEALSRIYDTDEYKEHTYDIYTMDEDFYAEKLAGCVQMIRYSGSIYSDGIEPTSDAEVKAIMDAMKKDTRKLDLDYLREEVPIGYLYIDTMTEEKFMSKVNGRPAYYSDEYTLGYLYPSFTETLALLDKYGMKVVGMPEAEDVEFIINVKYTDDDEDISERIEDRTEIEKLLPELVDNDNVYVNYALIDTDSQTNYEVHLKKGFMNKYGLNEDDYYGTEILNCQKKL